MVGAAALALLAAIVLPLVMDQEPKPVGQDIQIRIPSQSAPGASLVVEKPAASAATSVASSVEPAAPVIPVTPATPVAAAPAPAAPVAAPAPVPAVKPAEAKSRPEPKPEAKTDAKGEKPVGAAEQARAETILNGGDTPAQTAGSGKYVVQLGVFSDAANVKKLRGRIKADGYNSYTETLKTDKGMKTRVRAGPFGSKEAAVKARDRLKQHMGIDGIVAEK